MATFNTKLLLVTLVVIITVALIVILSDPNNPLSGKPKDSYKPGLYSDVDRAVNQATKVYQEKKQLREDFTNGPCLTNDLLPDWVADIAHSPRIKADDLPQNQCQAFREGRARHFVEMDPYGNVLRAI